MIQLFKKERFGVLFNLTYTLSLLPSMLIIVIEINYLYATIVGFYLIPNIQLCRNRCFTPVAEWLKRLALKLLAALRCGSGSIPMRRSCQLLMEGKVACSLQITIRSSSCGNRPPSGRKMP